MARRGRLRALARAKISQQIDYINARTPRVRCGRVAETLAVKRAFGEYANSVPMSSTKSMTRHLTSAAGAGIEAAATIMALKHGVIPQPSTLKRPILACDLDYVRILRARLRYRSLCRIRLGLGREWSAGVRQDDCGLASGVCGLCVLMLRMVRLAAGAELINAPKQVVNIIGFVDIIVASNAPNPGPGQ